MTALLFVLLCAASQEQAVYANLGARMKAALDAVSRAHTAAEADAARPELRRKLEHALGYKRLPWPPDLQPRVTGVLRKPGYRIEKVAYQGLPGEWIPAHLYLPDPPRGRVPGILFYNGHWFEEGKAKPDFQAFCINMARFGFAVLNFDAYGQGERGLSRREHRMVEGLPVGVAQQGFAVYDAQASLQYLLSRPEVDPERIGMTGASGGGFNTWMNAALDDRIKVAAPVVGTSDFYEQSMARLPIDWDPQDHCHYIPGLFRFANNHELVAIAAPKPLLLVSASEDRSFPVRGVRDVVEYGRALYGSYGLSERFSYFEDATEGHGYQRRKREAAYGWFERWLMSKGDGRPVREPATETLPFDAPELRVLPHHELSGPAMAAAAERLAAERANPGPLALEAVLGAWPTPVPWTAELTPERMQRLIVPVEPDLSVNAFLLRPDAPPKGLLVAIDDRGKEAALADAPVKQCLDAGWAVLGVDPRGIGESKTSKNTWLFAVSLMLGENFAWRQAWDVFRAVGGVAKLPKFHRPGVRLGLYARGPDAALAGAYLAAARPVAWDWFVLRGGFLTFRDFAGRRFGESEREIPAMLIPFDALESFDIPGLLRAAAVPGLVLDPIDGNGNPKPPVEARKLLSRGVTSASGDEEAAGFLRAALWGPADR